MDKIVLYDSGVQIMQRSWILHLYFQKSL